MKRALYLAVAVFTLGIAFAPVVFATGKPPTPDPKPTPTPTAAATAGASAGAAADAAATAGATSGSTSGVSGSGNFYGGDAGNFYVLPAPIAGGPLPAGMCQTSQYRHFSIGWSFVSVANGDSKTDLECLDALSRLEAIRREPKVIQSQAPVLLVPPGPAQCPVVKAKPKAAAKKASAPASCKG